MSLPDLHVAFLHFTFDSARYELSKQATRVHLSPKAFDLLHLLLARRPAVVRRQTIDDALWPDTAVGVSSLSRLMAEEAARLLQAMGAETRMFNPSGLPLPDDAPESHPKVAELRELDTYKTQLLTTVSHDLKNPLGAIAGSCSCACCSCVAS